MTSEYQSGAPWTDKHTVALTRAIVSLVLANRTTLYTDPELLEVANNHGDRIRKKTHQILHKLVDRVPGAEQIMADELTKTASVRSLRKKAGQGNDCGVANPGLRIKKELDTQPITKKRKMVDDEIAEWLDLPEDDEELADDTFIKLS
ncbi:hypothetical protein BD324DRAFT_454920 [Kockovaella imperatae]|uniref:Uncharacterized protein n=1 Tax=Kockovaella imperatae TaxID=4999 RepID=A0A1Y1UF23_9TREE|nr:hypothetical protein BD324DRAFT_454920 [Kockovaella imperatae]ORX36589.1 hypothetical protein BD324DRAFT_454920 [Kockovaella imperatae]